MSTAVLVVPEVQELLNHPTGLKVGGLLLNVVIVVYLVICLVRRRRADQRDQPNKAWPGSP